MARRIMTLERKSAFAHTNTGTPINWLVYQSYYFHVLVNTLQPSTFFSSRCFVLCKTKQPYKDTLSHTYPYSLTLSQTNPSRLTKSDPHTETHKHTHKIEQFHTLSQTGIHTESETGTYREHSHIHKHANRWGKERKDGHFSYKHWWCIYREKKSEIMMVFVSRIEGRWQNPIFFQVWFIFCPWVKNITKDAHHDTEKKSSLKLSLSFPNLTFEPRGK